MVVVVHVVALWPRRRASGSSCGRSAAPVVPASRCRREVAGSRPRGVSHQTPALGALAGPATTSGSADERARYLPDHAGGDGPVESAEGLLTPRALRHSLREALPRGLAHAARDFEPEGLEACDAVVLAALGLFCKSGGGALGLSPSSLQALLRGRMRDRQVKIGPLAVTVGAPEVRAETRIARPVGWANPRFDCDVANAGRLHGVLARWCRAGCCAFLP